MAAIHSPDDYISIHTPTRGATICDIKINGGFTISIHTPTRGATCLAEPSVLKSIHFNPHSHEGSDKVGECIMLNNTNFNPHSHEGSDHGQK